MTFAVDWALNNNYLSIPPTLRYENAVHGALLAQYEWTVIIITVCAGWETENPAGVQSTTDWQELCGHDHHRKGGSKASTAYLLSLQVEQCVLLRVIVLS